MRGGKVPKNSVHQGGIGISRHQSSFSLFTCYGEIDRLVKPLRKFSRNSVGILDEDDLKDGANELAPIGIVVPPHRRIRSWIGFLGRPFKGAVPTHTGSNVLLFQYRVQGLRRSPPISRSVPIQQIQRILTGLADLRTTLLKVVMVLLVVSRITLPWYISWSMKQFRILIPELLVRIHHFLKLCTRGVVQRRGTDVVRSFKGPTLREAIQDQCQTNYASTEHFSPISWQ